MTALEDVVLISPSIPHGIRQGLCAKVLEALTQDAPVFSPGEVHYATFGLKYKQEVHPTLGIADPDSSIRLDGFDADTARRIVFALTDGAFAFMYPSADFNERFHPVPPLLEVVAL